MDNTITRRQPPTCMGCVHYFVTHDLHFPYGCRCMGFKSRRAPCHEVEAATGEPCQTRQAKDPGAPT